MARECVFSRGVFSRGQLAWESNRRLRCVRPSKLGLLPSVCIQPHLRQALMGHCVSRESSQNAILENYTQLPHGSAAEQWGASGTAVDSAAAEDGREDRTLKQTAASLAATPASAVALRAAAAVRAKSSTLPHAPASRVNDLVPSRIFGGAQVQKGMSLSSSPPPVFPSAPLIVFEALKDGVLSANLSWASGAHAAFRLCN